MASCGKEMERKRYFEDFFECDVNLIKISSSPSLHPRNKNQPTNQPNKQNELKDDSSRQFVSTNSTEMRPTLKCHVPLSHIRWSLARNAAAESDLSACRSIFIEWICLNVIIKLSNR